jgi:hypothetical protein
LLGFFSVSKDDEFYSFFALQKFICLMGPIAPHQTRRLNSPFGRNLMSVTKSAVLTLALLAGTAVAAHAQSNIAALPPGGPVAATPPAYGAYPGPQPGAPWAGVGQQTQAVVPSGAYIGGPNPGAGTGAMPPKFQKSADWDQNPMNHPYAPQIGPRPN